MNYSKFATMKIKGFRNINYVRVDDQGLSHLKKRTADRYRKVYRILETYEGKLSSTVLRRGKAGNRFLLSE